MKNNLNRYIALFILILIGIAIYFFLHKEKSFENITSSTKYEVADSLLVKPKKGIENAFYDLDKLDSIIGNKELTIL